MERQLTAVEDGEWRAIPLDELPSRDEAETDPAVIPHITKEGFYKVSLKAKQNVGMPKDSEEFRMKMEILSNQCAS